MSKKDDNRFKWPIVGHSSIIRYLQQGLKNSHVSQAYLFVGPEHVGKTIMAENLVNSLVCKNLHQSKGLVPCGQCDCCQQVANKIHPDVFWVQRAVNAKTGKLRKNISIEQVRELQNKLSLHSFLDSYKVAVINEAQTLSQAAANSLLKTLEEPTPKTVIILLTTSLFALPRTIVSRCQILKFLPVSDQEIFEHLLSLKVERKKAKALAALSFGRPGIAINYIIEPDFYTDFQIQVKQFISLMTADINSRFKMIGQSVELSDINSIKETLIIWNKVLRDLILIKYSAENLVSNLKLLPDLKQLAAHYQGEDLVGFLAEVELAKRYLGANVNPKLTLENLVLNF
jgi:DNA polymerase-3 subunit delta'